jgi:hypothetical protein
MGKLKTPRQINTERGRDGKPPLNFRLIRQIIKKIETTPEAYDQNVWGRRDDKAPCGTAACIAGWACFLGGEKSLEQLRRNPKSAAGVAVKLLGLFKPRNGWDGGEKGMFDGYAYSWPSPFAERYQAAKTSRARARAAISYLKHVLKTGEVVG